MNEPLSEETGFDPDNPAHELTIRWLKKASSDYDSAQTLFSDKAPSHFENICFLCQQSVEKYLKSLLILHRIDFPKTHDINQMVSLLPENIESPDFLDEADRQLLNSAVAARYPDYPDELTEEHVVESLKLAEQIQEYVLTHLDNSFRKKL